MCLHVNRTAHVACNFNCLIETTGLLKVIGNHVHWKVVIYRKLCKIETLLLQMTNRKWYNCHYGTVPIPTTLSGLQGHSPTAGLLNGIFAYHYVAVDNISSDIARRAVPLRQLSLLSLGLATNVNVVECASGCRQMALDENQRRTLGTDVTVRSREPDEDDVVTQPLQPRDSDDRPPSLMSRSLSEYSCRPSIDDDDDKQRQNTPSPTCAIIWTRLTLHRHVTLAVFPFIFTV